jgi:ubiquinone/menaquinone biosynthesis C-methylase UbiE
MEEFMDKGSERVTPLVEERILQLFKHLGIQRAHIAGQMTADWRGLATSHPEAISSITIIGPVGIDTDALGAIGSNTLVFNGDEGPKTESVQQSMTNLPEASLATLKGCQNLPWTDVVADYIDEISAHMMEFLTHMDKKQVGRTPQLSEGIGEFAGLTYRISGHGPPIVLLPLGLAPSQWEPIVANLGEQYCTITLGGAALGFVSVLEARGWSTGYLRIVRALIEEVDLQPGDSVLEVGCGTGVISRWLARRNAEKNKIVGVDINPYLLGEAIALTKSEGLGGLIDFREGNAEVLPIPDDSFDITVSCTLLEEGNADQMLTEMIRVTKPGGRIAVIVRSVDMPFMVNAPIRAGLKSKIEVPGGDVSEKGCADVSLYRRFRRAGLHNIKMFPQMASLDASNGPWWHFLQNRFLGKLTTEELKEWQAGMVKAESEETFFVSMPYHCAVGTKPLST